MAAVTRAWSRKVLIIKPPASAPLRPLRPLRPCSATSLICSPEPRLVQLFVRPSRSFSSSQCYRSVSESSAVCLTACRVAFLSPPSVARAHTRREPCVRSPAVRARSLVCYLRCSAEGPAATAPVAAAEALCAPQVAYGRSAAPPPASGKATQSFDGETERASEAREGTR